DPASLVLVPDRLGVLDVDPPVLGDALARGTDLRVDAGGDREAGAVAPARPDHLLGVERRVRPYDDQPLAPHAFAVPIALTSIDAAPRAEPALPARSRVAATTGAVSGVDSVAISGLYPRSRTSYPPTLACPNATPCLRLP